MMAKLHDLPCAINEFKVIMDLKSYRPNSAQRYLILECHICLKHFISTIPNAKISKSCGCKKERPVLDVINGHVIVKDLGVVIPKRRHLVAQCKHCSNLFISEKTFLSIKQSCGCLREKYPNRLRSIYAGMISRCYDKDHLNYKYYGEKGIVICDEWKNDNRKFFHWSVNNGYDSDLTIDRIDPEKDYSPDNCQWLPMIEQIQKRRSNKLNPCLVKEIRKDLITMKNTDVAKKYGISKGYVCEIKSRKVWYNIDQDD